MSIGPISTTSMGAGISPSIALEAGELHPANASGTVKKASNPSEVARQFEAILVRQILSESMKTMLEHGKDGQVYGYYLTEALADGITKGGGLGLRSVLESQLRQQVPPQSASSESSQIPKMPRQEPLPKP